MTTVMLTVICMLPVVGAALWLVHAFSEPALILRKSNGARYLTRWHLISTQWLSVYVHRLDGPDPDRHMHNHPWKALVLVLRGSYSQQTIRPGGIAYRYTEHSPLRPNHLGEHYHKIVSLRPGTITLCICGPRQARGWGFLVNGEHMDWEAYVRTHQQGVLNAEGTVSGKKL